MALCVEGNLNALSLKLTNKYMTTGDEMQKRKVFFKHVSLGTGLAFYATMNHMP